MAQHMYVYFKAIMHRSSLIKNSWEKFFSHWIAKVFYEYGARVLVGCAWFRFVWFGSVRFKCLSFFSFWTHLMRYVSMFSLFCWLNVPLMPWLRAVSINKFNHSHDLAFEKRVSSNIKSLALRSFILVLLLAFAQTHTHTDTCIQSRLKSLYLCVTAAQRLMHVEQITFSVRQHKISGKRERESTEKKRIVKILQ